MCTVMIPDQVSEGQGRCIAEMQALIIKDSDTYYSQASSFQYIPKIKTPCLFPVALDDPFVKCAAYSSNAFSLFRFKSYFTSVLAGHL